ncbi:MAG: hypothetical protein WA775_05385 [Psychroserpens sp.]|uniref:hypothetical protein n=1 Tax=Psychroserpens sp. TaxID=2020870 RepID=UPI003C7446B9
MKTNPTNQLPCSVFGHNLERSPIVLKDSQVLTCKTCHTKVRIDDSGELNVIPFKNREIDTALRQLFLLRKRSSRRQFSA